MAQVIDFSLWKRRRKPITAVFRTASGRAVVTRCWSWAEVILAFERSRQAAA